MPRTPCPHKNFRLRTLVATTLFAALALASLAGLDTAHAQRGAKSANTSKKSASTKRVFVGRGSDSGAGSRQTIKSDNPLNDYSAYRSGDRFNVIIPNADANAMGKGGAGRGYTDMQVQQRGNDVVLSYKLQPGAKPRVEQKFNRLDVVFETPEGGAQPAATRPAQSPAAPATNDARAADARRNQTANRTAQTPAPSSTTGASSSRTPNAVTQPANPPQPATRQQQTAAAPSTPGPQPGATAATTTNAPADAPQSAAAAPPEQLQLAQAGAPETSAPATRTSAPATTAVPGPSFGATLLRNWPLALIGALLVVGLFFAARRSSATSRTPHAPEEAEPAAVAEAKPVAIE
ncbi:MAG TPA: hypothetical protein VE360_16855, partial [Pyrinomonadaceae bacterium]|nr:hypothetical protein [Pyrinomonadaceae bacterium]